MAGCQEDHLMLKSMAKTIVVIPTYNEADNLGAMTEALFALGIPDLHILIVDDASPDGTGQLADTYAQKYPGRFDVMHRTGKQGLGTAYIQGFHWAIEHGAQVHHTDGCRFLPLTGIHPPDVGFDPRV